MADNAIDSGSNEAARAALASLIDLHGPALLHEPDRLKRQLDGALPDAPREVELILSSMREEVPHALLAAHSDDQLRTLFPQLVERLVRKTGIDRDAATRAVRTWAHALAVAVESRGDADRPDGMRRSVDRPTGDGLRGAGGAHPGDASSERERLEERESSRRSSTAEVLGFGARPVRLKAPSTVRPTGPLASPPPAAETLVAFDASRERAAEPSVVEADAPAATTVEAIHEADLTASAVSSTPVAPMAVVRAPVDVPPFNAPPHEEPPLAEPVAPAEAPAAIAVEAAPAVVPEIIVPPAPLSTRSDAAQPTPPDLDDADEATLPFAPQRRSSSRTFALAAAIAAAVIVIGATLWPTPQTTPTPEARTAPSASTAARPTPAPPTVAPAPVASATVASAPVEPPPVAPSEPVVATSQPSGQAVATSEPPAPAGARTSTPESVASPNRDGTLPVGAEVTAPAVIPFTPPAPKPTPRVVKQPEAPPISRQAAVAPAAPKPTKAAEPRAADPRKPTATPAACTRSTCGSVVSVRAIDDAATRDYEVIVRLDDRTIRAVRMPARWSTGARVRVVGGRFEPAGDR